MNRQSNLANTTKRFLQLHPNNATSGGIFSPRNGLVLVRFDISSSQAPLLLDGSSLRLSGNFTARQVGVAPNQLTNTDLNFVDGFCGVNMAIENVTISSKRLNQNLERINQYYRLCPSVVSGAKGFKEMETELSIQSLSHNTNALTRPGLNTYNQYSGVGAAVGLNQRGSGFSMPLYAGIFQSGQDIDLSSAAMGGCTIEILLRASTNVVFGVGANANQAYYELSNLVLTAPVYEVGGAPAQNGQFSFNSWSSMFQTVNSSDSVLSLTPGLGRVTSCLINSVTATDLGNQLFNSSRLGSLGEIQQLRWSANGALLPLQYRLQTVNQQNNGVSKANVNAPVSFQTHNLNSDIVRNYLEGIKTDRYNKVAGCNLAYNNWSGGAINQSINAGRTGETPQGSDGLAILYDSYGSGQNFSQRVWSIQLRTSATNQLNNTAQPGGVAGTNRPNCIDGTAATAQACSVFFLSKNTILFGGNGIDVQR